ncbi:hypothetical protein SAMN02745172_03669 [Pseudoxanthobacter soli DSM 19599]|uniref:Uncharacterized protein n=1 Tax=Pseudoxanthobacter soli DSM 19599 TaxID=1123029 RepID=A0A1M7ZQ64_9HYPH|nr:hypothetical protein [Pseudoxanthobacter soli]SHO67007.1 hypothetical protein SAMN02745172_03669 [Pseudoxanthobacter soli DSM 19599]
MLSRIRIFATAVVALSILPVVLTWAQSAPSPRLEAQNQANALFERFRVKCGKDHVAAIDVTAPQRAGFTETLGPAATGIAQGHTIYIAYADIRLDGRETTTDIDRRNGISWRVTMTYSAAAVRQISVGSDGTEGAWSSWQTGGPVYAVTLMLKDGNWSSSVDEMPLLAGLGRYARLRRPACAELPSG